MTAVPAAAVTVAQAATIVAEDTAAAERVTAALAAVGFAFTDGASDLVVLISDAPARERIERIEACVLASTPVPVLATMPRGATGSQLRKTLQVGAAGIVLDGEPAEALAASALAVAAGQLAAPRTLARRLAPRALSHREKQILGLVVQGYTNRQIADELYVAQSTVKTHLSSALRKLDARSRAEAAALILDPDQGHGLGILTAAPAAAHHERPTNGR